MKTYKVKLSDGDIEWWEKLDAKNENHLYDQLDSLEWDVEEIELEN